MNRRELLKLLGLSGLTGVFGSGLIFGASKSFAAIARDENQPLYCGWINSPEARCRYIQRQSRPFLGQMNQKIKGTGAGKTILLWPYLERAYGHPLVPHMQTTGDCFVSGTQVTMADGTLKEIQDVKIGDYVISHLNNYCRVLNTIKKPYNGPLVTTKCSRRVETITSTPDHKFITSLEWKHGQSNQKHKNFVWSTIDDLSLKQGLIVAYGKAKEQQTIFDLSKVCEMSFVDTVTIRHKGSKKIVSRFIPLDKDFAWLIGIYLAEGGVSEQKVTFNLNKIETNLANKITAVIKKFFNLDCKQYGIPSHPNVLFVECYSIVVAKFFKSLIPGNIYTKEVPEILFSGCKEARRSCLKGWLDGDGCLETGLRKNGRHFYARNTGVSVSYPLIKTMDRLARTCELNPRINIRPAYKQSKESYQLCFASLDLTQLYPGIDLSVATCKSPKARTHLGTLVSIDSKIPSTMENGYVYCLDVEKDHSFIANGFIVHNCVSHAYGLGIDILNAVQIFNSLAPQQWVAETATEVIYGGARVQAHIQLDGQQPIYGAGAIGVEAAEFVKNYGILLRQKYGKYDYSRYDGEVADQLGETGVPVELLPICKLHPIQTTALCRSWEEARDAICNGFPVMLCSNVGFSIRRGRDKDGFLSPGRQPWRHAMCLLGADDNPKRPGGLIENSWGSSWVDGPMRLQPEGSFWADASVIDRMCRQGDSVALSNFQGFPLQTLEYQVY